MQEFLSITLIIILAAISPGPDFALVTKNSLAHSRKTGIYTALGVSLSLIIHTIYCILGLAIVISQSLLVFSMIKYLGALYLIYIGVKGLMEKRTPLAQQDNFNVSGFGHISAFYQGLLCNLLNPKAIMFLLAFFTLIVKPGNNIWLEIGYGVEIAAIHMIWFSSLSVLATHPYFKSYLNRAQYYIVKAMGAALVAFGLRIATLSQAS